MPSDTAYQAFWRSSFRTCVCCVHCNALSVFLINLLVAWYVYGCLETALIGPTIIIRQCQTHIDMLRRSLHHGTGLRGKYMGIEEGTGKQIGGRRNENARDVICLWMPWNGTNTIIIRQCQTHIDMLRRSLDHGTGVRGRYMGIEEGTGKQIGGRRNENATMNVRSYEVGHDKQLKNTRNIESGEIAKRVKEKRLKRYGHVMTREVH